MAMHTEKIAKYDPVFAKLTAHIMFITQPTHNNLPDKLRYLQGIIS